MNNAQTQMYIDEAQGYSANYVVILRLELIGNWNELGWSGPEAQPIFTLANDVPEPGSIFLMAAGLLAIIERRIGNATFRVKKGRFRLLDATSEEHRARSQTTDSLSQNIHQLSLCIRPAIGIDSRTTSFPFCIAVSRGGRPGAGLALAAQDI